MRRAILRAWHVFDAGAGTSPRSFRANAATRTRCLRARPTPEVAGELTDLGCPDCRGVLAVREEGRQGHLAFACSIGHAYSGESLISSKEEQIEDTLWSAVEVYQEIALLHARDVGPRPCRRRRRGRRTRTSAAPSGRQRRCRLLCGRSSRRDWARRLDGAPLEGSEQIHREDQCQTGARRHRDRRLRGRRRGAAHRARVLARRPRRGGGDHDSPPSDAARRRWTNVLGSPLEPDGHRARRTTSRSRRAESIWRRRTATC